MARKCANWLESFETWILPRSEAPLSYIRWSGLFTLAAALRREIWIPKSIDGKGILGTWECYPHIYVILVGPPGMRKTTALSQGLDLTEGVEGMHQGPNAMSRAFLAKFLLDTGDYTCYLVAEEFSDLFLSSGDKDMYEFLTSLFDGKKKFTGGTISRDIEFLDRPCVNLAAGTTPTWLANNIPPEVIGGGFSSRVIWLYEDELRMKRMYWQDVDFTKIDRLEKELVYDITYIANKLKGEVKIEKPTLDWFEEWYQAQPKLKTRDPKLQGYYSRKHVHIHKVAMLYHVAYSDELVLTQADFEWAIQTVEEAEKSLPMVFAGVGRNLYTLDMREILNYIKANSPVAKSRVYDTFMSVATPDMLEKLIGGLLSMRKVKAEMVKGELHYT